MSKHDTIRRHAARPAGHTSPTVCPPRVSRSSLLALAVGMAWALALGTAPARAERLQLSDIVAGHGGFVIYSSAVRDNTLASAGDVNGDGLDDVLVGEPYDHRVYVIFGKTGTTAVDTRDLDEGIGGFVIQGEFSTGWSVAGAGDINGDGLADVLVDVPRPYEREVVGKSYVVFGKTGTASVHLANLKEAGGGGFMIRRDWLNYDPTHIVAAGDVNGDGLDDLVVGRPSEGYYGYPGAAYVVFGKTDTAPVELADVEAGHGGYVVSGHYIASRTVAGVGDVNADGLADIALGSPYAQDAAMHIAFGKTDTAKIDVTQLDAGIGGFVIRGGRRLDTMGASIAGAGDVNGDGFADIIIGSQSGPSANAVHVVLGKRTTEPVEYSDIEAGVGGFMINGISGAAYVGASLAGVGDIDGDGLADVIVGPQREFFYPPVDYVVFGQTGTGAIELSAIAEGTGGFAIDPEVNTGSRTALAGGGDINGDGLSDLLVASPDWGTTYVIFGATTGAFSNTEVDRLRGPGDDTIVGNTKSNVFVGGAGNDTFVANGGADVLYGGTGDDVFLLKEGNVKALQGRFGIAGNTKHLARLDGGSGLDTLRLVGAGIRLDLTKAANQGAGQKNSSSRIESIERIDLTGTGDNTLTMGVHDVQDLAGMNLINSGNQAALGWINGTYAFFPSTRRHQLVVDGDAGDLVKLGPAVNGWQNAGTVINHGVSYDVYNTSATPAPSFERVQVIVAHAVRVVMTP